MSDIEKVGEPRIIPDPDAIHVELADDRLVHC